MKEKEGKREAISSHRHCSWEGEKKFPELARVDLVWFEVLEF